MQTNLKKTVWELDARWLRVEACDEAGRPLGLIYFEPNDQAPLPVAARPSKSRSALLPRVAKRLLGAWAAVRHLRPAMPADRLNANRVET